MENREEWRVVAASPYEVSDKGRVRRGGRVLCIGKSGSGYCGVTASFGGRRHYWMVHRIVAAAFVERRSEERREVNHIDGNKKNNRADNLEWVTHSENHLHAARAGLSRVGERSHYAKLTADVVLEIRRAYAEGGRGYNKLARDFGINRTTIAHIVRRETWAHLS